MDEYHKINTVYKRDTRGNIMIGDWADPVFEFLAGNEWVFTEKVDGTNIRVEYDAKTGAVLFGGRTDAAQIPQFLVNRLNELFQTTPAREKFKAKFEGGCILFGEGHGAKIQKGGGNYKADGQEFVLFDVKVGDWWLNRADVEDVAAHMRIGVVPVIGAGTLHEAIEAVKNGQTSKWGDFLSEGIVARPKVELRSRNGARVIAKIKHRDFAPALAGRR